MRSLLHKRFLVVLICFSFLSAERHPIYVSVTEIEHSAKDKQLQVSCKIFTDDFEKALRNAYKTHVDLQDGKLTAAMDRLVNDYVQKHLKISVNGSPVTLKYLGYEKIEEGIYSYYQADNISSVKTVSVTDNILFEYKDQQMNLIHCTVGGERKSTKLDNPDEKASFSF